MATSTAYGLRWDPREPIPPGLADEIGPKSGPNILPWPAIQLRTIPVGPEVMPRVPPTLPHKLLPSSGYLAPLAVTIKGQVLSDLAVITVHQTFENDSDQVIPEAHYTFPLPDSCTVTGFSARVGNAAVLRAKVKPKAEARAAFNQAVREDRFAALLEEHTTEVFTASIGNIPSRFRIKTEISYVFTLSTVFSAGEAMQTFLVPTSIGPRYGHAPFTDVDNPDEPDRFSLELDVLDAENTEIKSRTHQISIEFHDESEQVQSLEDLHCSHPMPAGIPDSTHRSQVARVRMRDCTTYQDTDLEINIHRNTVSQADKPIGWLEKHPVLKEQYALMLQLPPSLPDEARLQPSPTGELIFVADRSGSMYDKMDSMRLALQFFLKGIPLGWKFNIWSFGTKFESMWPESRVYDAMALAEALSYLDDDFDSDMGGTELLSALKAIVSSRNSTGSCADARCEVMIITDGAVWNVQETLDFVENARRSSSYNMRFFALGIGRHVSAGLVNGIARCGGGYSEIIPTAGDGNIWQGHAVTMLKTALSTPTRHKVTLQLAEGTTLQAQTPHDLTITNSPFSSQRVFLLLSTARPEGVTGLVTVKLSALDKNGHDQQYVVPARTSLTEPGTLHALAARACLTSYSATKIGETGSRSTNEQPGSPLLAPQALACRYSLLSRWTSLVLEAERPTKALSDMDMGDPGCNTHMVNKLSGLDLSPRKCMIYAARGVPVRHYHSRPRRHISSGLLGRYLAQSSPYSSYSPPQSVVEHEQARLHGYAPSNPQVNDYSTSFREFGVIRNSEGERALTSCCRSPTQRMRRFPRSFAETEQHESDHFTVDRAGTHQASTITQDQERKSHIDSCLLETHPCSGPQVAEASSTDPASPLLPLEGETNIHADCGVPKKDVFEAPQDSIARDTLRKKAFVTEYRGEHITHTRQPNPEKSCESVRKSKETMRIRDGTDGVLVILPEYSPEGSKNIAVADQYRKVSRKPKVVFAADKSRVEPLTATTSSPYSAINIMGVQSFDGSFPSEVIAYLDQGLVQVITALQSHIISSCSPEFRRADPVSTSPWSKVLATTVVTLVVLRRDFAESAALWALMEIKGRAYVNAVAVGCGLVADDLFARAEAAIEERGSSGDFVSGVNDNIIRTASSKPGQPDGFASVGADWIELDEAPY